MFEKVKKNKNNGLKDLIATNLPPPLPQKKQFSTMNELLRDAEKYDNEGEKEIRDIILTTLCEFIEKYKMDNAVKKLKSSSE